MPNAILALNAGSSSIKFALFGLAPSAATGLAKTLLGEMEGIGTAPHFIARAPSGAVLAERRWPDGQAQTHEALLDGLLGWIETHLGNDKLIAVGHRVVHGGRDFTNPVRINTAVLNSLEALTPLAPLHQPHSIAPMRAIAATRPGLPQIACFDTAFHHTMPEIAKRFAIPFAYEDEGVRRYGFHGLSYEYIAQTLRRDLPHLASGRVIVAHLGSGASLCAIRNGQSLDTTTGFTALEGLVMGTRCGCIDPGVLLYLLQQKGMSPKALEHLLYSESGLLGVSGMSSDMRTLATSPNPRAKNAVDLFVYRIARETAALAACMGGLDGFIFTAGIGEHAPEIQDAVCASLAWLGIVRAPRTPHASCLSAPASRIAVHVIPTDEEAMIAQHTLETLAPGHKAAR